MNICTYVSAVSMVPKIYAVAVYHNTKTHENISGSEFAVLQLLHADQYKLVKKLGQTSGKLHDKAGWLESKGLLTKLHDTKVLAECSAYLFLKKLSCTQSGDHTLMTFCVLKYVSRESKYLTSFLLRDKKIIRA